MGAINKCKAEKLKVLSLFSGAMGPDHPNVATSLHNLAALYRATKRSAEAEKLEACTMNIRAIKR